MKKGLAKTRPIPSRPYAEEWWDKSTKSWRERLSTKGLEQLARYYARYPDPLAVVRSVKPGLIEAARRPPNTLADCEAEAHLAIVKAHLQYELPSLFFHSNLPAYITEYVLKAVCRYVTRRTGMQVRTIIGGHDEDDDELLWEGTSREPDPTEDTTQSDTINRVREYCDEDEWRLLTAYYGIDPESPGSGHWKELGSVADYLGLSVVEVGEQLTKLLERLSNLAGVK